MSFSNLRTRTLLTVFRSRFTEDLTFLLAITLAAGFYAYEARLPLSEYLSLITTLSMIMAWIWISFASGFMKRGVFVVFSLAYWLIPQFAITSHADTIADFSYDVNLHTVSRFAEILVRAPLDSVCEILDVSKFVAGIVLLLLCEVAFFGGFIFREKCKNRQWYRSFCERYKI
ncbi:MAG: hypothetical protein LBC82_05220 [Oscillospiraceae bacterium]|jgi:hypothetical protein|nr:hypothetical protein [Oscillospiraceae bacterium]